MMFFVDLRKPEDKDVFCKKIQSILFTLGFSWFSVKGMSKIFSSSIIKYKYICFDDSDGELSQTSDDDFIKKIKEVKVEELKKMYQIYIDPLSF